MQPEGLEGGDPRARGAEVERGTTDGGTAPAPTMPTEGRIADLERRTRELERRALELERELARARREVIRAGELKSDFLAVVNHELRTPLSALLGYLFLAQRKLHACGTDPEAFERLRGELAVMLEKGRLAGNRLVRLLDELAAMEWVHRDDLPITLTTVTVPAVIQAVCDEVKLLAPDRRVRIVFDCDDAQQPVLGDAEKLMRLFEHVIGNAVKYTPDGGTVHIHCEPCELADGPGIHVTVRDGGVGIPRTDLERIFEPFYHGAPARYHSTGKTKFMGAGLGLGLPVSRGIARAHGGALWAESIGFDPERCPGATVHLTLPKQPPAQAADLTRERGDERSDATR